MKSQSDSLNQGADDVIINEAVTVANSDNNSVATDNVEEEMSHSAIVTTECVAYRCTVDGNLTQTTDRVNSVIYDVPFTQ